MSYKFTVAAAAAVTSGGPYQDGHDNKADSTHASIEYRILARMTVTSLPAVLAISFGY